MNNTQKKDIVTLSSAPHVADRPHRKYENADMKAVYESKSRVYKVIKRVFDIVVSGLGIIILSPLFLVIAVLIKAEDGGTVFFTGQRYGKDMKYFPMHKFRSMCMDAETKLPDVLKEEDKNGLAYKIEDDPRVTRIGRFIRRTSIDELPQLWNVFKGDMSIVGPRPIKTTDMAASPYDKQRWLVRPGLTCYWQISGRSLVPWEEWVEMDLEYINNMSIAEDIKIILKTIPAVIRKDGAR